MLSFSYARAGEWIVLRLVCALTNSRGLALVFPKATIGDVLYTQDWYSLILTAVAEAPDATAAALMTAGDAALSAAEPDPFPVSSALVGAGMFAPVSIVPSAGPGVWHLSVDRGW